MENLPARQAGEHADALVWPVWSENLPAPQRVHAVEAGLFWYLPAAHGAQTKFVSKKEKEPGIHEGVHEIGHIVAAMLDCDALTGLDAEEPSVPAGHPFWTLAEAPQIRVPVAAKVLSGQVSSSLAVPSR